MNENFKKIYEAFARLNDSGFSCSISISPTLKKEEYSVRNNNMEELVCTNVISIERDTKFKVKELQEVIYPILEELKNKKVIIDYRKRDFVEIYY